MDYRTNKTYRMLHMNEMLASNDVLRKGALKTKFDVTEKTMQRDIESLRCYLDESGEGQLLYDRKRDCYYLKRMNGGLLSEKEVFAVCKILIESRAFNKEEFEELIGKLLLQLKPEQSAKVKERIINERVNYLPLKHGKSLIDRLWELASAITEKKQLRIWYVRQDKADKAHKVMPVGLMFSEFYFYLIAWIADGSKNFPTVFRVDRITDTEDMKKSFKMPYSEKFSEAEFRKRVQFMYSGELKHVKFVYRGPNVEAVLDRLPTAKVVGKNADGSRVMTAESYGDGIDIWLKGQGEWIEMLE